LYKHFTYCILIGFLVTISTAAEPAKPLAGRVVDENDQPLAGAGVRAMGRKGASDSIEELASATTGTDGRFSLDGELRQKAYIVATKKGKCFDWAYPALKRNAELVLRLGKATTIEGSVIGEAGKPVAGAAVNGSLKLQSPYHLPSAPDGLLKAKTDSQGHFSFDNLPAGALVGFDLTATGYARALCVDEHGNGPFVPGQRGLRFVLPPEGQLEGVVCEKGTIAPLVDVWVQAHGSVTSGQYWAKAKTDKDGRFRIVGLSGGKYETEIIGVGDALPTWIVSEEKRDESNPWHGHRVQVEPGKTASGVKIEATRGGTLEVVLTDAATGKPITSDRACVTVCPAGRSSHHHFGLRR
jgi:hypothetical protein